MDEPSLFDVAKEKPPKKKRTPKAEVQNDGTLKGLMYSVYWKLYVERYREEPLLLKKHWVQLKTLLDRYGPALVESRLRQFFASRDEFISTTGHTMGVFFSQWQKLAALDQQNQNQMRGVTARIQCRHRPACQNVSEHSRRLVAELRGQPRTLPTQNAFSPTTSKLSDPF